MVNNTFVKTKNILFKIDKRGLTMAKKGVFYKGNEYELYKRRRNKWIRLAIAGFIIPIFASLCISNTVDTIGFTELLGNGDIVLSLYALTLPMLLDIFDTKSQDDDGLSNALLVCLGAVVVQMIEYVIIRINIANMRGSVGLVDWLFWKQFPEFTIACYQNILRTIIVLIITILACMACIGAMENHSEKKTAEKGGENV